ncbi:MAG: sterol desaturase family protein [Nitrospinae bacterium]|nr:sterol desaturase family protein [Nitrospinota bacterium]
MNDYLLANEPAIRLVAFFGVFALMALGELRLPRRPLTQPKARRWAANLGIVALNTVAVRLLFPAAAIGVALMGEREGWGLLNRVDLPGWLEMALAVILLDMAIYLQHVLFHAAPSLWRLHRVHHVDLDYDVTTGARFHPVEIVLSMLIKMGVVAAIGAGAAAVLLFEVLLNATAMFNHANVRLPLSLDALLRRFVVTPDFHRVHHSVVESEANSNFGFNLPWWDYLFGTYQAQPAAGHEGMEIGIHDWRDGARQGFWFMLRFPFVGSIREYAINRRGD